MTPSRFDRRQHAPVWVVKDDVKVICTGKTCAKMVEIWLLTSDAIVHEELINSTISINK